MILQAKEYETEQGKSLQDFFDSTAGKWKTEYGYALSASCTAHLVWKLCQLVCRTSCAGAQLHVQPLSMLVRCRKALAVEVVQRRITEREMEGHAVER